MYDAQDHTFVLCAYGESPYLIDCILSLRAQSLLTRIVLCTSTPNDFIRAAAAMYQLPLFINKGEGGIAQDWNFALEQANTPLATIAHQDDIYEPQYAESMLEVINSVERPLMFFTNYGELRDGVKVEKNLLLDIKRRLLRPLEDGRHSSDIRVRHRILSLGSAICCPSVTLVMQNLTLPVFQAGMQSNLDWEAWEAISRLRGDFLYNPRILMYHRIHDQSETSALIKNDTRTREDLLMFRRFWPTPIAYLLSLVYARAQKSNSRS